MRTHDRRDEDRLDEPGAGAGKPAVRVTGGGAEGEEEAKCLRPPGARAAKIAANPPRRSQPLRAAVRSPGAEPAARQARPSAPRARATGTPVPLSTSRGSTA